MKKQLWSLLLILVGTNIKSQTQSTQYTHYAQYDTIMHKLTKDIAYNTTVFVDVRKNQISIEDNYSKMVLDIAYSTQDDAFYQCIGHKDNLEWKVSILSTNTQYLCVVSKENYTKIFKKQR